MKKSELKEIIREEIQKLDEFAVSSDYINDAKDEISNIVSKYAKKWGISTLNVKKVLSVALKLAK